MLGIKFNKISRQKYEEVVYVCFCTYVYTCVSAILQHVCVVDL